MTGIARAYGTCPRCGQGARLLKSGRTARHQRKQASANGSMLLTIQCRGGLAVELEPAVEEEGRDS